MGNVRRESQLFFCSVKVTQSDCAFGPTLAASIKAHVQLNSHSKKQSEQRTLPTAALTGCGFGYTNVKLVSACKNIGKLQLDWPINSLFGHLRACGDLKCILVQGPCYSWNCHSTAKHVHEATYEIKVT